MNYSIIFRPLIGAGIGYITNFIAIRMMFRPLKPIRIGKFTLPFTPGIIPKNKERLAEAIGASISENLLTEETLKETLLSDSIKSEIKEKVIDLLNYSTDCSISFKELICNYIKEENYDTVIENINSNLTSSIFSTLKEANLGDIIAKQIEIAAQEKFKSSMLGFLGGNVVVSAVSSSASEKINSYINTEGETLISNMVSTEIEKYTSAPISDITTKIGNSDIDLVTIIMNLYEKFIIKQLPTILSTINISKIITNKINSMEISDLEKMILNIMKKELNSLVNLGAIIGFILGLLNLLF